MIEQMISSFIDVSSGLHKSFLVTELLLNAIASKKNKILLDFIHLNCKVKNETEGQVTYSIPGEKYLEHLKLKKDSDEYILSTKAITNSYIVTLISQYDVLVSDLARFVLIEKPELLTSSEKTIKLCDLLAYKCIDDAKNSIIDKEIDTLLRGSHIEQLEWFEKKLSCDILKDKKVICQFVEITERRNLCVHTNGVVTVQYLQVCHDYDTPLSDCIKIGDSLNVDIQYLTHAVNTILEISIKLVHFVWYKTKKNECDEIIASLLNSSYSLLVSKGSVLPKC